MKYFEKLMSSNKGRILWLILILIILFFPLSHSHNLLQIIVAIFLSWLAVNYLANKLNLKHKRIWQVMTILFGLSIFTYLVFLIAKREQLKSLTSESQIKTETSKGLKRIYRFLIDAVETFFIAAAFFLLGWVFIARLFQFGTGMEPTIKKGSYILNLVLPLRFINPGRLDIVSFKIPKDPEKVYTSRIIGVPGDKIVLKDGYVYLNGKLLDEPYTLKPRSTWVNDNAIFGKNCEEMTVPKDYYFLLGDNRRISEISIYLGFISKDKIIGYVPHNLVKFLTYYPIDWSNHIRDASHDKDLLGKSILNASMYVELLNRKRRENGLPPLISEDKANKAASYLLKDMIEKKYYTDEKSKADPALLNAFSQYNITSQGMTGAGLGLYDAQGLLDFYLGSRDWENVLLSPKYSTIGVASTITNVDSCPQQLHVTLYFEKSVNSSQAIQPPTLSTNKGFQSGEGNTADIKYFQDYISKVQALKDSWQNESTTGRYPQQDVNKVVDEFTRIISFSNTIMNNLRSGSGNNADNNSLWKAISSMNDEAIATTKRLNGQ